VATRLACSISSGLAKLCPGWNEDVMDAWMPFEPGARLETVVTGKIIGDDKDVTRRMVGFDVSE